MTAFQWVQILPREAYGGSSAQSCAACHYGGWFARDPLLREEKRFARDDRSARKKTLIPGRRRAAPTWTAACWTSVSSTDNPVRRAAQSPFPPRLPSVA